MIIPLRHFVPPPLKIPQIFRGGVATAIKQWIYNSPSIFEEKRGSTAKPGGGKIIQTRHAVSPQNFN